MATPPAGHDAGRPAPPLPEEAAGALRAIRTGAPEVAPQAARTLAILFDGYIPPGPSEASPLNMGGGPVEFSCSGAGAGLRYTVDIGGPVDTRLARIRDRIRALDPAWDCPALDGWQPGGRLRWGAWLGVRHRTGLPPDFKVYVETPPGTAPEELGSGGAAPWPDCDGRRLSPVLAGFQADAGGEAGRREVYFEMPRRGMPTACLERLLAQVGLERRAAELTALVDAFEFRHPAGALPDARLGFSYSLDRHGRAPVFSLFAFAADLVGDDRAVRRQILRRAAARTIDLGHYAALTAPLAEGPSGTDVHNILAFLIDGAGAPTLQITFRPPGPPGEGARHDQTSRQSDTIPRTP